MSFSCNNIITIIKDNISLAFSPGKKIAESEHALILSTAVKFNTIKAYKRSLKWCSLLDKHQHDSVLHSKPISLIVSLEIKLLQIVYPVIKLLVK
jgi:hypothetical protein